MNRSSRVLSVILSSVIVTAIIFSTSKASPAEQSERENVAQGINAFAVQAYHELGAKEGNLFFSPYSVSAALGMTYAGARENTAREMKAVLNFKLDPAGLPPAFKSLNRALTAAAQASGQKLNIANALVLTGGDVGGDFKSVLKDNFSAEIFPGDLSAINGWVEQKTEGKIKTILERLSTNSVCVLLNAIYFKGIWESQFKKKYTRDAPFRLSAAMQVTVPIMHQKGDFKLLVEKDFQAISIVYKGNALSMVVLLPKAVDGLAALEKQLIPQKLKEWSTKLDAQPIEKIDLYMPKFKLETDYDLVPPFKKMGLEDAFGTAADFSGMGWKKGSLWISQIKHKAFVEVNEEGTEAAAATAVEMETKSLRSDPVFRVDHPFLFFIRDNQSGTILFIGRLADPD